MRLTPPTLRDIYQDLKKIPEENRRDFEILFAHHFGRKVFDLNSGEKPGRIAFVKWLILSSRLEEGEPLAYLMGTQPFFEDDFIVNKHVLIPRPETEYLAELILKSDEFTHAQNLLDIGCGCGVLAVTLKKKRPQLNVTAVDISAKAIKVAKSNAKAILGSEDAVKFVCADFLKSDLFTGSAFDFVVSNPPYVLLNDQRLDKNVRRFEPALALYGGSDGLDFYRRIAEVSGRILAEKAVLFCEFGEGQAAGLNNILQMFDNRSIIPDLSGRERYFTGRYYASTNSAS